ALAEDGFPAVCTGDDDDCDPTSGWDMDLDIFPEVEMRPEVRLFAGTKPDVTFSCRSGRKLLVHRHVLSEVSYFESLFDGGFAEQGSESLQIDEDLEVFVEVMRWIYCRSASCDKDMALDLLRLAEFYGIEELIDHASRVLAAQSMGAGFAKADAAKKEESHKKDDDIDGDGYVVVESAGNEAQLASSHTAENPPGDEKAHEPPMAKFKDC
ncbi:unnamed protein product, partial [Polarella glacialis]